MNKAELIVEIQKQLGKDATKACAEKALNTVLDAIKAGVKKHKKLQLIGFGTFSVVERKARTGINPQTKERSRSRRPRL
ncbi:MAG: HU family DNA-binding protein [Bacilli bacterium]